MFLSLSIDAGSLHPQQTVLTGVLTLADEAAQIAATTAAKSCISVFLHQHVTCKAYRLNHILLTVL